MPAPSERDSTSELASGTKPDWLGNSGLQGPKIEISRIKIWPSITAVSYHREGGESIWRGDRPRLVLAPDPPPVVVPPVVVQIEQERSWQITPLAAPANLAFYPAGLTVRVIYEPAARFVNVVWDQDLYSTLLPELGGGGIPV